MSTETKTEELRGLRYRIIDALGEAILLAETPVLTGAMADAVLDVLRADPSAVIAALGGKQVGWADATDERKAAASFRWLSSCPDATNDFDRPVWVLGEQP